MNQSKIKGIGFILLMPVIFVILAFIFDNVLIYTQTIRVQKNTENIITEVLTTNVNDYYAKVKKLYEDKKIDTDLLEVIYDNNYLTIYNSHSYDSFCGKLIGINSYRVEIKMKAYLHKDEVIIEKIDVQEDI